MKESYLKFEYKYSMKKNKKETDIMRMVDLANCGSLVDIRWSLGYIKIDLYATCANAFETVSKFLSLLNTVCDVELVQSKEVNNEQ